MTPYTTKRGGPLPAALRPPGITSTSYLVGLQCLQFMQPSRAKLLSGCSSAQVNFEGHEGTRKAAWDGDTLRRPSPPSELDWESSRRDSTEDGLAHLGRICPQSSHSAVKSVFMGRACIGAIPIAPLPKVCFVSSSTVSRQIDGAWLLIPIPPSMLDGAPLSIDALPYC